MEPQRRPRSILIVDDSPDVLRRVREVIAEGFADALDIVEARSGAECLSKIEERAWDVVLLDVQMPDSKGFDVLHAIKRERADADVIMLSVLPADLYASRAHRAGASGYIEKHRVGQELVPAIRALLDDPSEARS